MAQSRASWITYMLECADGSLYVGSTTDVDRRLIEHNTSVKGARYTKTRRPVVLRYTKECTSRSEAQKHEAVLKKLSRENKLALLETPLRPFST